MYFIITIMEVYFELQFPAIFKFRIKQAKCMNNCLHYVETFFLFEMNVYDFIFCMNNHKS